jgi:hypothetical protein
MFSFNRADFTNFRERIFHFKRSDFSFLPSEFSISNEWIFHFYWADFLFFLANVPFYRVDFLILQSGLFNFS